MHIFAHDTANFRGTVVNHHCICGHIFSLWGQFDIICLCIYFKWPVTVRDLLLNLTLTPKEKTKVSKEAGFGSEATFESSNRFRDPLGLYTEIADVGLKV